jgi:hypothetical protein
MPSGKKDMSAASRDRKTLAYQLGEALSGMTDHYLLMTATPHKGDPDNFCLFLELLDRDVYGDVKTLFTKRIVQTTEFQISEQEWDFYDALTRYVEDQSIKAASEDSARGRALGFTMAMLQRRFASRGAFSKSTKSNPSSSNSANSSPSTASSKTRR